MSLQPLEQAERLLAQVAGVQDAVAVRDLAEGARVWARQARLGTSSINHATVVKMRAERRLAELVDAGQAADQIATPETARLVSGPDSGLDTYEDLGLTKQRVAEARTIRDRYSDAELVELGAAANADDKLLSRDKLVRTAGWQAREQAQGRYADTAGLQHADVLYVDPPWRYEHSNTDARAVENQYPTMTLEQLAELTLPAGEEAVLFLWATAPKLQEAIDLLDSWRFTYRTHLVWDKQQLGMGYYVRGQHELLLIAVRGTPPLPAPADRPPSVLSLPRGAHSQKPIAVYELIERMYPHASKRELFARHRRAGWLEPWGLEVPA